MLDCDNFVKFWITWSNRYKFLVTRSTRFLNEGFGTPASLLFYHHRVISFGTGWNIGREYLGEFTAYNATIVTGVSLASADGGAAQWQIAKHEGQLIPVALAKISKQNWPFHHFFVCPLA